MALALQLDQVQVSPGLCSYTHFVHVNESQCVNTGKTSSAVLGAKQGQWLTQAQPGGHLMGANVLNKTSCTLPDFHYCPARYREGGTADSSQEPEEVRQVWQEEG